MAQETLFVIEGAMQGKLHPNGETGTDKDVALDYVNAFNLGQSEDSLNARADGKNKITLKANKAMTFTAEMEVMNFDMFLVTLGATKDAEGKVHIGDSPSTTYTYTGKMKLKFPDGTRKILNATIANCTPQITEDFGTSSLDLQTYSVTFDVGTDDNGDFMTFEEEKTGM